MTKKLIIVATTFLLIFSACNETGDTSSEDQNLNALDDQGGGTITEIDVSSTTIKEDYDLSSFSEYVYFHKTEGKILIDYNFFPEGTDVCQQVTYDADTNPNGCQQAETIVLPCSYETISDDLLSVDISATTDDSDCDDQLVLDVSGAEFTVDGLVFSFSTSLDVFVSDFQFKITKEGFVDSDDGQTLSGDGLEAVYTEIVEKKD